MTTYAVLLKLPPEALDGDEGRYGRVMCSPPPTSLSAWKAARFHRRRTPDPTCNEVVHLIAFAELKPLGHRLNALAISSADRPRHVERTQPAPCVVPQWTQKRLESTFKLVLSIHLGAAIDSIDPVKRARQRSCPARTKDQNLHKGPEHRLYRGISGGARHRLQGSAGGRRRGESNRRRTQCTPASLHLCLHDGRYRTGA
jgi:hypothetical protein